MSTIEKLQPIIDFLTEQIDDVVPKFKSFICDYLMSEDERLKSKDEESTHLSYTGLLVELEHLTIETKLIDEKFANSMGEYVTSR